MRARATDTVGGETYGAAGTSTTRLSSASAEIRDAGTQCRARLSQRWPTTGLTLEESPAGETTAVIGRRNALRLGGFASLDLRASRALTLRVGSLDVFVEVSNATNRKNPCCVDFDLEEGANGEFLEQRNGHWLPRLATFGVLWQF